MTGWIKRKTGWLLAVSFVLAGLVLVVLTEPYPTVPPIGHGSRFMVQAPPGPTSKRPFDFDDPDRYALILYLNGSTQEGEPDSCNTSRPGINIPKTATDLVGRRIAGFEILLYAFCTPTRIGGFNQPQGDGIPKVVRRAEELRRLLLHLAETGFPPQRIFVMGQSAGAWAGLLVQRHGETPIAGLVGFAPAFAGFHQSRRPVWQAERDRQVAYIAKAPRLDALIYGFEQDRFEPPEAMDWLQAIPGVTYVALSGHTVFGIDCDNRHPHSTVFKDCFRYFQRRRILEFLESRLSAPSS